MVMTVSSGLGGSVNNRVTGRLRMYGKALTTETEMAFRQVAIALAPEAKS
jgi:hypothetical protein